MLNNYFNISEMNKFSVFAALLCAAAMGGAISSCNKPETPDPVIPEVSVEVSGTTVNSVSFTITATDAAECAYSIVKSGETVPSAEDILSDGTAVDLSAGTDVTVDGLESATAYTVAVAVASEDGNTAVDTAEATTAEDPAIRLDRASGRQFGTSSNFGITLRGTVDGIDYEVQLDMYDDEGAALGYVTDGSYAFSDGISDGDVSVNYSYIQKGNDQYKFVSGTVTVKYADGEYSIRVDSVLNDESSFACVYEGAVDGLPAIAE